MSVALPIAQRNRVIPGSDGNVENIIIIGGKGTAVNVAEQIDDAHRRFGIRQRVRGFAIDDPSLGRSIAGFPVVCGTREVSDHARDAGAKVIFALYRPEAMRERVELLASYGLPPELFTSFVHPQAYVGKSASIGRGSVVFAHASLMKGVAVGDFCILNSQVIVEHDTRVGDNCFLGAGACVGADITLGRGVFIGMQAVLRPGISVGDFAFVNMGAIVTRDVEHSAQVHHDRDRRAH